MAPKSRRAKPTSEKSARAAILARPGVFQFLEVPVPIPREKEIRVKLEGCGVCGSNLPPWEGRSWFQYPFTPGQPGHEGWGRIDAVGKNVSNFNVGDRVALLSFNAFAEYDVAPESSAVRLPDALDGKPFPGEALGCAVNAFNRAEIKHKQNVAIVGIGFLGAVIAALCARAGANVIAISRRPFALATAKKLGAATTFTMENDSNDGAIAQAVSNSNSDWGIIERVRTLTSGIGCDCVIEATGLQRPLDLATELTRERGRLVIAGYHQDGIRQVNMQLWNWRGLDVINAHERDPKIYIDGIRAAAGLVAEGKFDPSPLYTHQFAFSDLARAFNVIKERPSGFMKAMVTMAGGTE